MRLVNGIDLGDATPRQLADFRLQNIGFIFQSYNLIPVLTAAENADDYASQAMTAAGSFISSYGPDVTLDIGEPTTYDYTAYMDSITEEVDNILNNDVINTKYKLFSGLVEKDTGLESIFASNAEWNSRDPLDVMDSLSNRFNQQFTFGSSTGGLANTMNDLASFLANGMIYDENGNLMDMPEELFAI